LVQQKITNSLKCRQGKLNDTRVMIALQKLTSNNNHRTARQVAMAQNNVFMMHVKNCKK